jgi:iron complex outermembrane recepter protein
MRIRAYKLGVAILAISPIVPVQAQVQAPAQVQGQPTQGTGLEEIVVTAQKRQENLQNVPSAVTAVSAQTIERYHVTDIRDLTGSIPNINFTQIGNQPLTSALTIRGIGIPTQPDPFSGTEVAVVIDGVVQGTRLLGLADQFDVDRIEVLRGPQGTLFGANTTGGVVNIITRQPTGQFDGQVRVSAGNYNRVDVGAAVDFPIINDVLAGKVSISNRTRNGYFLNTANGEDIGSVNSSKLRGYLKLTPATNFDATLILGYDRIRDGAIPVPNTSFPGQALYQPPGRQGISFQVYSLAPNINRADMYTSTLTANLHTSIGTFTSITNYSDFTARNVQDVDDVPAFLITAERDLSSWQFSQEVRLAADLSKHFQLLAGGFYMKLVYNVDTLTQPQGLAPGRLTEQFVRGDEDNLAGFVQANWEVTDRLRLGAGVRLTQIKSNFYTNNYARFLANPDPYLFHQNIANSTQLSFFEATGNKTWMNLGGKISVDYRATPGLLLYGYYARGFKAGGFNGRITDPRDVGPYNPEFVDSFEVGFKSDLLDRRLRVNVAAFWNIWANMQVNQSIFRGAVSSSQILNAAAATTRGIEIEAEARPVAGLRLSASLGYLYAKYNQFSNLTTNYSGRDLPYAPKWTASASASYIIPVGSGTLTPSVQYTYQSSKWSNFTQSPTEFIGAVNLVHANLAWSPHGDQWEVALWARNLFNVRYLQSGLNAGAFSFASYGAPREYGVDLTFKF